MKNTIASLFFLSLLFVSSPAIAAEVKYPVTAFYNGLDQMKTAKYQTENVSILYDVEGEPVIGTQTKAKGSVQEQLDGSGYDSVSNVYGLQSTPDSSFETKMDFIRKGNIIYIKFKNPSDKDLRNKWIQLNEEEYKELGEFLGMEELFDLADASTLGERELEVMQKSIALTEKYNLYRPYDEPKVVSKKKQKTITYFLEVNPDVVASYYNELAILLSDEEEKDSILGVPGFKEGIKNTLFAHSLSEGSAIDITFNSETMMPIQYLERNLIPAFGSRKGSFESVIFMKFANLNKKVKMSVPTKTITVDEALQLLKN